ncbi:hypothetical protein ACQEU8_16730 [Streptomyces sp. CA-250714]|uniref:hypothetical protein n=1 Tax=Streptomyces sp. CA-250714 TaxID=3240060 RepID=UPI003D94EE0B
MTEPAPDSVAESIERDHVPCSYCDQYRSQITVAQHKEETELEEALTNALHLHWRAHHAGERLLHST